jgi:hypothetical protein
VYATDHVLWAVGFDPQQLVIQGEPVRVRDDVLTDALLSVADFDLSDDGTLVYRSADLEQRKRRRLTWVDRAGQRDTAVPQLASFQTLRLSPDGRSVAVNHQESLAEESAIWIYDLGGRPPRRLVTGHHASLPTFSPDGRTVYFVSFEFDKGRWPDMYAIAADGSEAEAKLLVEEPHYPRFPLAVSPDGKELLFWSARGSSPTGFDLLALPLDGDEGPHAVVESPSADGQGSFSPDGRWIAYASTREGSWEVFVQAYPDGPPQRVSPSGGRDPVWSRSGDELYYRDGSVLLAVSVSQDPPSLTLGTPQRLFELDGWPEVEQGHSYDVAPDGRFLVVMEDPEASGRRGRLTAVVGWGDEVQRLVPGP